MEETEEIRFCSFWEAVRKLRVRVVEAEVDTFLPQRRSQQV